MQVDWQMLQIYDVDRLTVVMRQDGQHSVVHRVDELASMWPTGI